MCCCCPPAISALFCLWVQSGFSKGSVAGALTFFPPEPPLYEFERRGKNGEVLTEDDEEETGDEEKGANDENETDKENETSKEKETDDTEQPEKETDDTEEPDDGELITPTGTSHAGPLEQTRAAATTDKKKKKTKSPAAQLTERAKMLRSRSKARNARDKKDAENGVQYVLILDPRLRCPPSYGAPIDILKLPSKDGTYLATVVYRVPADHVTPDTKTIIYSHGNATDVGAMYPLQAMLVQSLLCHVISYDYSGYGESGGVAMEANTYKDIATVYDYALKNVAGEGNAHNIVLYGQSVGSGPSCYLCSKIKDIGGLILHSPFTSGMRVLTPSRALACLDIYPNINRIRRVKCPVLVIHGKLDEEVSVSHGMAMHNAVPSHLQREPWWVPDRGHNDITEGPGKMAEYLRRLRTYLMSLD